MKQSDEIQSVVARFFNVPQSEVTESFAFPRQRLEGSVARTTLHAALKRLAGVDLASAFTANTYGQLLGQAAQVAGPRAPNVGDGSQPSAVAPAHNGDRTPDLGLGIGIDIEHVGNLPGTGDVWTDSFYLENFTSREIAYCVRQPNPRLSLCGIWSAKEAVIKSCHSPVRVRPGEIEIGHDDVGMPVVQESTGLRELAMAGPMYLSISHSDTLAVAVSVRMPGGSRGGGVGPSTAALLPVVGGSEPPSDAVARLRRLAWLSFLLSVLSLVMFVYEFAGK